MRPHRSLVARLLGTSVLIVALSVGAVAWLAAKTATRAVQQERVQSLAGDSQIYDTLLGYAATHPNWDGVEMTIRRLAEQTGRQISLTTIEGKPIIGSGTTGRPDAVLDPLGATIDPRAVGPYLLSPAERSAQRALAEQRLSCLQSQGLQATLDEMPSGRTVVRFVSLNMVQTSDCLLRDTVPTRSEAAALKALARGTKPCLVNRHLPQIVLNNVDFTWHYLDQGVTGSSQGIQDCVDSARRTQLRPYVAQPARLYLTNPARPPTPVFDLSSASALRIAGVTVFVLIMAITATLVVGMRLVRPLRALTAAADRSTHRLAPVAIVRNDEIGRLATAFNALAERSERSEEQRRTMVNDIAHELRSPLTNIRSWLTAGQDGLADLDQEMVRLLLEEASHLQHIVDDLSDLADADAGTLALHRDAHAVAGLLVPIVEAHPRVGLRVSDDPWALVDPVRFRQIVVNLLTNAIQHTPPDGRVDVRARREGDDVVVEVADPGDGIAPADLPHVFDRFWRADRSRGRATGGSGLGLSIARKLAQAHGGDVTAASTPGTGSTFTIRLPALRD